MLLNIHSQFYRPGVLNSRATACLESGWACTKLFSGELWPPCACAWSSICTKGGTCTCRSHKWSCTCLHIPACHPQGTIPSPLPPPGRQVRKVGDHCYRLFADYTVYIPPRDRCFLHIHKSRYPHQLFFFLQKERRFTLFKNYRQNSGRGWKWGQENHEISYRIVSSSLWLKFDVSKVNKSKKIEAKKQMVEIKNWILYSHTCMLNNQNVALFEIISTLVFWSFNC